MKNLISFIFAVLMIFVFGTAAGFRFYEGEWVTGVITVCIVLERPDIFR